MVTKQNAIKQMENKCASWVRPELRQKFIQNLRSSGYYKYKMLRIHAEFFWLDIKRFFTVRRYFKRR